MVSINVFRADVEFHARGTLRNVIKEFAPRFMRTRPAVRVTKGALLPVHFKAALSRDLDGISVEPPIDQIEVMSSFMYPQTTALGFQSMPASKIIGTVIDVQVPTEINRNDAANLACH